VRTDELAVAPTSDSILAREAPPRITTPSLGKKARKAFVSPLWTASTKRSIGWGSAGLLTPKTPHDLGGQLVYSFSIIRSPA